MAATVRAVARGTSSSGSHAANRRGPALGVWDGVAVAVRVHAATVGASVTANHVAVASGASVGVGPVGVYGAGDGVGAGRSVGVDSGVGSHVPAPAHSAVAMLAVADAETVAQYAVDVASQSAHHSGVGVAITVSPIANATSADKEMALRARCG